MSQSLQIRSVISIVCEETQGLSVPDVAIPSNQVGNFHLDLATARRQNTQGVAIPSNQVGNFHRDSERILSLHHLYVAIPSNQVGNFHRRRKKP